MLSKISSVSHPLGFTSPFVRFQLLCNQDMQWDETVNEELKIQ